VKIGGGGGGFGEVTVHLCGDGILFSKLGEVRSIVVVVSDGGGDLESVERSGDGGDGERVRGGVGSYGNDSGVVQEGIRYDVRVTGVNGAGQGSTETSCGDRHE